MCLSLPLVLFLIPYSFEVQSDEMLNSERVPFSRTEGPYRAAFQLWKICIQNKTKYYSQQIHKGKIVVPTPK